jgi:hypothetical protein
MAGTSRSYTPDSCRFGRWQCIALLNGAVRDEKRKRELTEIIDEIRQKQADRNFIIHAAWMSGAGDVQGHILKRRPKKDRVEIWSSDDIAKVADQSNAILGRLVGWLYLPAVLTSDQAA